MVQAQIINSLELKKILHFNLILGNIKKLTCVAEMMSRPRWKPPMKTNFLKVQFK